MRLIRSVRIFWCCGVDGDGQQDGHKPKSNDIEQSMVTVPHNGIETRGETWT